MKVIIDFKFKIYHKDGREDVFENFMDSVILDTYDDSFLQLDEAARDYASTFSISKDVVRNKSDNSIEYFRSIGVFVSHATLADFMKLRERSALVQNLIDAMFKIKASYKCELPNEDCVFRMEIKELRGGYNR